MKRKGVQAKKKAARPKAATPPPAAPTAVGVTRAVLAAALDVPPGRINQWLSDGMPVARRGHRGHAALYNIEDVRAWREAREKETSAGLSLETERALLAREQRLKLERESRVKSGELVDRDEVTAETKAGAMAVRTRLLQLPRQMGQAGIITREQEPAVTSLIHEALRELVAWRWVKDAHEETTVEAAV